MGFANLIMMAAIIEHGIPDAIGDDGASAAELADDLELDAEATHRVLRSLAAEGLLDLDQRGRFRLTRVGRLLRADEPGGLAPWVRYLSSQATQDAWRAVGRTLVDGEPGFAKVHGMSLWDWFALHPEEGAEFGAAMAHLTEIEVPAIVAAYPMPRDGLVCDVAGGRGALLAEILDRNPNLRGVVVDRTEQMAGAVTHLERRGLSDRARAVAGDIFDVINVQADLYLLKDILHDWSDDACLKILRTIRAAAPPGSRVLVIEMLQPENTPLFPTSVVDTHMLTQTDGGRQRSLEALRKLLTEAGFEPQAPYSAIAYTVVPGLA